MSVFQSIMQGQKHILVVDNQSSRQEQLATVLAFIGEHYYCCKEDEVEQYFAEHENILTVILSGNISDAMADIVKAHPACPFIPMMSLIIMPLMTVLIYWVMFLHHLIMRN